MILTPLQKLPKNVGDLAKLIVAKGFEKLLKVQKIAKSGHTGPHLFWGTRINSDVTQLSRYHSTEVVCSFCTLER